ncbi:hypothetical protein VNO77_21896 [Canavalia gladiata]|uniref:Uncharacterized protein n=1 Tax=Canavalia gladiata TaxID=3824 RepID=A0AAN9L1J7_CANGL
MLDAMMIWVDDSTSRVIKFQDQRSTLLNLGYVYILIRLLVHPAFFATTKVIKDGKEEVVVPQRQCSNLVSSFSGNVSSCSSSLFWDIFGGVGFTH